VGSNPAAVTLFGLTQPRGPAAYAIPVAERALGIDLRSLEGDSLPVEDWPAMPVLRGETLQGAKTVDVVVHTLDGRELILNVSGAPLFDAGGQVRGAVCVSRDTTDRVHLEREVAARAAELENRPLPKDQWPAVRILRGETLTGGGCGGDTGPRSGRAGAHSPD
jgi:hypothetical protein